MYQLIPAARNVGLGDTTSYVQLSVPFVTKLISAFANGLSVFISCVTNLKCVALMFSCLLTSEGKVEMLRKGSIHAVILGIFSVAIMSDDISEKFKFKRVRTIVRLIWWKKNTILPLWFQTPLCSVPTLSAPLVPVSFFLCLINFIEWNISP